MLEGRRMTGVALWVLTACLEGNIMLVRGHVPTINITNLAKHVTSKEFFTNHVQSKIDCYSSLLFASPVLAEEAQILPTISL